MSAPTNTVTLNYAPRGAGRDLFACRDAECILVGPAGTGKSRSCLEKVHLAALKYPGMRGLMVRKTRRSLTESGIVTYERKVLHSLDGVIFHHATQQYRYPNGSIIAIGGLDKPGKIMSSEWDIVYAQEATELLENDWEAITTRLRNGKMPYQQLIADCNPDAPTHWLRLRMDAGKTKELLSRHEDNPTITADYLSKLDALTGVRLLRLRHGIWASAEGMVYQDAWDRARNVIDRFPIPPEWPRYLSIDFGFTNPLVCQWWAADPDGRLYRYREIYHTKRLVEDVARQIKDISRWGMQGGDPFPRAIICDHDAEDRATLERHLGLMTTGAVKAVGSGIQAVASRMRAAGDGRARLFLLRDSLVERDGDLVERHLPTCTEDEIESYVWDVRNGAKKGEAPVKANDHGQDCQRYLVMHLDASPTEVQIGPQLF